MMAVKLNKFRYKLFLAVIVLGLVVIGLFRLLMVVNFWFDTHTIKFNRVVELKINSPITIEKREIESPVVIKTVEELVEDAPDIAVAKYIVEKFGAHNAAKALAIQKAENGTMKPDRYNVNSDGSIDIGIFQINSIHWDRYGGLAEMVDPFKNVDAAYDIFVRAGESFSPWVAYTNGSYLGSIK